MGVPALTSPGKAEAGTLRKWVKLSKRTLRRGVVKPWGEALWGGRPEGKALPQSFRGVSRESHTSPGPQAGQLPAASPGDTDPALPRAASALGLGTEAAAPVPPACAPVRLPAVRRCRRCVCLCIGVGCMSGPPVCLSVACLSVEHHCRLCVIVGCLCFEARGE